MTEAEVTDAELIVASRNEPVLFRQLYDRRAEELLGYFYRRVRDAEVAADLLAETFAVAASTPGASQFRVVVALKQCMAAGLAASLRNSAATATAFSLVYEATAEDVLVFLARRTFDVEVARDLTAETFAQAFEHRGRFRGRTDSEAEAWLYGIARHQLGRYVRRGVIHREAVERLGILLPAVSEDDHERVVELAGLADLRVVVADALATLPRAQREALRLRVIEEYEYGDVAERLGVTEQAARARVSRALRGITALMDTSTPAEVSQ